MTQPSAAARRLDRRALRGAVDRSGRSGRWALPTLAAATGAAASELVRALARDDPTTRRRLPGLCDELLGLPDRLAETVAVGAPLDADSAVRLARATALALHVRLLLHWQAGQARRPAPLTLGPAGIAAAERDYVVALGRLRRAAEGGVSADLLAAMADLARGGAAFGAAVERVSAHRDAAAPVVTVSGLARAYPAAAAGAVLLAARLAVRRRRAAAVTAITAMPTLRRPPASAVTARSGLTAMDAGTHLAVVGRTTEVEFVERPRKPYSRLVLAEPGPELRVPYRNVRRLGLTPGRWVWAAGEVKDEQPVVLEVEFEGPGQHRRTVFEDYLADLARPAYDRYPGVLQLEWQLPDRGPTGVGADVICRLRPGGGDA